MKVLFIHSRYKLSGGEDSVLALEEKMLNDRGVEVKVVIFENKDIKGFLKKATTFFTAIYSFKAKKKIAKEISSFKPDIIHVHNFFPLVSPSIYDAARTCNVPVIQTLHNFRIICPGALLLRDGKVCEKCIQGNFLNAIYHKCYRDSYFGSLSLASSDFIHKTMNTWNTKVDAFICLTSFAKKKFVQSGIDEAILRIKPNFVDSETSISTDDRKNIGLFVGRISQEKGIMNLIKIHDKMDGKIIFVGDGPLLNRLKGLSNYIILGRKPQNEIAEYMKTASFLIFPSICYEGFPMSIVEAYSNRLPVIASKMGAMEEIVIDGKTGCHFLPDDLEMMADKINWAFQNYSELREYGENAYLEYTDKYTSDINYSILLKIYEDAIGRCSKNS